VHADGIAGIKGLRVSRRRQQCAGRHDQGE
jgi:hypothetical protein